MACEDAPGQPNSRAMLRALGESPLGQRLRQHQFCLSRTRKWLLQRQDSVELSAPYHPVVGHVLTATVAWPAFLPLARLVRAFFRAVWCMKNEIGPAKKVHPKVKRMTEAAVRLDKAMTNLEAFWLRFQRARTCDRVAFMPVFYRAQAALEESSLGAAYVADRLVQLEKICKSMIDPDSPLAFGEACALVSGSVEVRLIRFELCYRRLVPNRDALTWVAPLSVVVRGTNRRRSLAKEIIEGGYVVATCEQA